MNEVVTCGEMKEIEQKAAEGGLSYYQMMENAGTAAARVIRSKEEVQNRRLLVICGNGNNGGDGFVVARKLHEEGAKVSILLVHGEPKTLDAIRNLEICREIGLEEITCDPGSTFQWDTGITFSGIIVDAIYGTGFHGELKDEVKDVIRFINDSGATVFSLDIPSGINGDTGERDPYFVKADCTVVFHRFKPAHKMNRAEACCGDLILVDIGIDQEINRDGSF